MLWKTLSRIPGAKAADKMFRGVGWLVRKENYRQRNDLRLHLGCGSVHLAGYINIDRDQAARADLFLDMRHLMQAFNPGCATEVLMIHSLGYLNLWQARGLFRDVHRLLVPGGRFILETPDIEKCAEKMAESAAQRVLTPEYLEGIRGIYAFGLDHMKGERDYTPYAFGWTGWHLKAELESAGFTDVNVSDPQSHMLWRDLRVEALKS